MSDLVKNAKLYCQLHQWELDPDVEIKTVTHEDGRQDIYIFYVKTDKLASLHSGQCIRCSCPAMPANHCHMCDSNCVSYWMRPNTDINGYRYIYILLKMKSN